MDINSILVGIDFSEGSRAAFRYATELARRFGARTVLVHVISDHDLKLVASVSGEDEAQLLGRLRREAEQQLRNFITDEGSSGLAAETLVCAGAPYQQIALKARELAADLIVMGGGGMTRDRMAEAFFGSTAEKVVRLMPCPVLCVPAKGGK